uniref:Uncharacterized protein n=1 Tax=Pseudonaja textilis TaxID=8673 RepID=A0A670ZRJ7_PSETE
MDGSLLIFGNRSHAWKLRGTAALVVQLKNNNGAFSGKQENRCIFDGGCHLDCFDQTVWTPLINPSIFIRCCFSTISAGQTALHIAIEKRNYKFVKLLVKNGADVHAKASGFLFQKDRKEAHFYFGELPLSLAACTNQPEVVMYLLDNRHNKAKLTEQDSMGNTVLHALVMVANNTEKNTKIMVNMYDRILMKGAKMDPPSKLEVIKNGEQLTPLTLAVKTGKVEILRHMLQRDMKERKFHHLSRKLIEWTYGPIQSSLYDLTSIDSCEENSMMETLAYNSDNRYEMLALEPLNKLLQHKWESFIRKRFLISFFFHLIFMTIFTVTAYNWSPKDEVTTLLLKKWMSVLFWRRRHSLKGLLMDSCFDILFVQALAILASSVMFFANTEKYVLPMVFALLLGWMNMLYYTRGCQQTGICLVMIQKGRIFHRVGGHWRSSSPTPCSGRKPCNISDKIFSNLFLKISSVGELTTSGGKLFHWLIVLTFRKFLLISRLLLSLVSFHPLLLVLPFRGFGEQLDSLFFGGNP